MKNSTLSNIVGLIFLISIVGCVNDQETQEKKTYLEIEKHQVMVLETLDNNGKTIALKFFVNPVDQEDFYDKDFVLSLVIDDGEYYLSSTTPAYYLPFKQIMALTDAFKEFQRIQEPK